MGRNGFPKSLEGGSFYLVGIKGTGMSALAEILVAGGARVTGSDTDEEFYTGEVLRRLGIPFHEGFSPDHVDGRSGVVIHSLAYAVETNPELRKAATLGLPLFTYPEALGELSRRSCFAGIAGTHGKTTTTAIAGTLAASLDLPVSVLVGSEVPTFGNRSTLVLGSRYLIGESCEYRRSFLLYRPDRIVVTNLEADHLDYYRDIDDIIDAFAAFCRRLPEEGALIYNADSPGVKALLDRIGSRGGFRRVPFGRSARGDYRIESIVTAEGESRFKLEGSDHTYRIRIPAEHSVYNAVAALALIQDLADREGKTAEAREKLPAALIAFRGTRRRSEVLGIAGGVLFLDDYAHHPTAVSKTLQGLRSFYPSRRLVVDFMSHTYSRTRSFLREFGKCFESADSVILHRIYSSARERSGAGISGRDLYDEVRENHPDVRYFENPDDAREFLEKALSEGDLFITMGAGSNWRLGWTLYRRFAESAGGHE